MHTIDLIPHLDAGDRNQWQGDQTDRPLTDLGRRQADALAGALGTEPVDALYSGPALRCRQTLEPLAERLGLKITVLPELGEEVWRPPDGWREGPGGSSHIGAFAAGMGRAALDRMAERHPDGRVVACSHGHTIPALVAFLAGAHRLDRVPELSHRGQWYRVTRDGDRVAVELCEAPDFPR